MGDNFNKQLVRRVEALMRLRGIRTQAELARRLGRTEMWLVRRLTGQVDLSTGDITEIAAVLEIPEWELVGSHWSEEGGVLRWGELVPS